MDFILIIILLIFLIGVFSANKKVEEEESYMAIQLFAFYILGLLSFTVSNFMIPIGIVIFFLIRPFLKNKKAKTFIAMLGFVVLLINYFVPLLSN